MISRLLPAQGRVPFRGVTMNRRTVAALKWAEKRAGFPFGIAQGSYHAGVAASAGTHNGGGVIDVRVQGRTELEIAIMLRALKDAGFCAWRRYNVPGLWGPHIHAVLRGDPELAPLAKAQVLDYDAGNDGLASHRKDPSYRPKPRVKFNYLLNKPVAL